MGYHALSRGRARSKGPASGIAHPPIKKARRRLTTFKAISARAAVMSICQRSNATRIIASFWPIPRSTWSISACDRLARIGSHSNRSRQASRLLLKTDRPRPEGGRPRGGRAKGPWCLCLSPRCFRSFGVSVCLRVRPPGANYGRLAGGPTSQGDQRRRNGLATSKTSGSSAAGGRSAPFTTTTSSLMLCGKPQEGLLTGDRVRRFREPLHTQYVYPDAPIGGQFA